MAMYIYCQIIVLSCSEVVTGGWMAVGLWMAGVELNKKRKKLVVFL